MSVLVLASGGPPACEKTETSVFWAAPPPAVADSVTVPIRLSVGIGTGLRHAQ